MAQDILPDDQKKGHEYDDNLGWYSPSLDQDSGAGTNKGWYSPTLDEDGLEDSYNAPSATNDNLPEGHPDRKTPSELKDAESGGWRTKINGAEGSAGDNASANEQGKLDRLRGRRDAAYEKRDAALDRLHSGKTGAALFGGAGMLGGLVSKAKGKMGKRTAKLLFGAGAGLSLMGVLVVVMILFASLKIPNFVSHITTYHMARTTRLFNESQGQIDAERLAMDTVDDTKFGQIKQSYQNLRENTWGKFDKYRPQKVLDNMKADGVLEYKYGEPEGFFRRQKLKSVVINGEDIPINDQRLGRFFSNYKEKLRFTGEMDANLNEALKGHSTLVRSSVAKKIRTDLGIKLRWWEKKAANYDNANQAEADRIATRESYQKIQQEPGGRALSNQVEETANKADNALDNCVQTDNCVDGIINSGGQLPAEVDQVILDGIDDAALRNPASAVASLSTVYAVAAPLCMVYEGSLQKMGPVIDAQNASAQRSYSGWATRGNQQQQGDTNAAAVGASNRQLGNIADTPPELRAGNTPVDTSQYTSPQASTTGDFTIMSALLPPVLANFFNPVAEKLCPQITNVWVGAGVAIGEIVGNFFTGGGEAAAGGAVKLSVTEYMKGIVASLVSKKGLQRLATEAVAIGGTTLVARLLVLSRMGSQFNGLARDRDNAAAVQADMGGKLNGEEMNRQMMYGRPLTAAEAADVQLADAGFLSNQKSQQGAFERYASLSNPDSLLANTIVRVGSTLNTKSLTRLPASIGQVFGNGLTPLLSPFTRYASAASPASDYNVINWGYSASEEALIANDTSYFPLANQQILDASGQMDAITSKYDHCFTDTMGTLLSELHAVRNKDGSVNETEGDCSPLQLGLSNPVYGDLVFRYRLYNRNKNTLDHLIEIQDAGGTTSDNGSKQVASQPLSLGSKLKVALTS